MSEQITFETDDFISNPEPRCPCVLLLDVSGSMNGKPLDESEQRQIIYGDTALTTAAVLAFRSSITGAAAKN